MNILIIAGVGSAGYLLGGATGVAISLLALMIFILFYQKYLLYILVEEIL